MIGFLCTLLSLLSFVGIKDQCYNDTIIYQDYTPAQQIVSVDDINNTINSVDENTLFTYYITAYAADGNTLTDAQMKKVLEIAGWDKRYIPEALSVSFGESKWRASVKGDSGTSLGLFQIKDKVPGWDGWWSYFGFDSSRYYEPVYNAQLALKIFNYEQARSYVRWSNWSVKPVVYSAGN